MVLVKAMLQAVVQVAIPAVSIVEGSQLRTAGDAEVVHLLFCWRRSVYFLLLFIGILRTGVLLRFEVLSTEPS